MRVFVIFKYVVRRIIVCQFVNMKEYAVYLYACTRFCKYLNPTDLRFENNEFKIKGKG